MNIGRPPVPQEERFWKKVEIHGKDECWPWTDALTIYGYGKFKARINGAWTSANASRIAWLLSNGEIPHDMAVCHKCDNRKCCNPHHLFLGTNRDNVKDKVRKGRQLRGEAIARAKLTAVQIIKIRQRYALKNTSWSKLAKEFGVTKRQIGNVVSGKSWNHIGDDGRPIIDDEPAA